MSVALRTLCLALVSAYAVAAVVPCDGASATTPGMDHFVAEHDVDSPPCHGRPVQTWKAKCPCGCGAALGAEPAALDPGLLSARAPLPALGFERAQPAPPPVPAAIDLEAPDPVPLAA